MLCCSSEVEVCWQLRAKEHHKVTLHNKPQTRDLFRKAQEKGWLSLLWWAAAENWAEGRLYIGFLGVGRGQEAIQDSLELEGLLAWIWALFSVMRPATLPPPGAEKAITEAARVVWGWRLAVGGLQGQELQGESVQVTEKTTFSSPSCLSQHE